MTTMKKSRIADIKKICSIILLFYLSGNYIYFPAIILLNFAIS